MNCQAVAEAEKNMVFAARLTQQGHKIASMDDLMELYEKSFSVQTVAAMGALPHPTIQKFAVKEVNTTFNTFQDICGDHGSHCLRQQAFSGADHPPPERSKIYECIAAVQQLYGTGGFRCPVFYYDGSGSGTGIVLKKL